MGTGSRGTLLEARREGVSLSDACGRGQARMDERIPRPRTRPQQAPTARVGMKLGRERRREDRVSFVEGEGRKGRRTHTPAGSLIPKVITVRPPLTSMASRIDETTPPISSGRETQRWEADSGVHSAGETNESKVQRRGILRRSLEEREDSQSRERTSSVPLIRV